MELHIVARRSPQKKKWNFRGEGRCGYRDERRPEKGIVAIPSVTARCERFRSLVWQTQVLVQKN